LHQGQIIEQGNHTELLNLKGHYYELYQRQLTEDNKETSILPKG
jgi:ATP-binding cassette subfamily B protein